MADAAEGGDTRGNDANDESETNDGGEVHDDDEHDDYDTLLIHAVDHGETALESLPSEVATIHN